MLRLIDCLTRGLSLLQPARNVRLPASKYDASGLAAGRPVTAGGTWTGSWRSTELEGGVETELAARTSGTKELWSGHVTCGTGTPQMYKNTGFNQPSCSMWAVGPGVPRAAQVSIHTADSTRRLEEPPRAAPEPTDEDNIRVRLLHRPTTNRCVWVDPRASFGAFGTHATGVLGSAALSRSARV